ncbi:substrate-binding domain-containing protein [Halorussus pelagicus]|uniref:substrate-binding domain-containing protein n=1 Tax=Halorussus pelagicus TaxID=2505977 RepID=UPI000FFB7979|nr:substrate-binding domain-containing protein [Halorussus pelagicus]
MRRRTLLLSGCAVAGGALGVRITGSDFRTQSDATGATPTDSGPASALVAGSLQTVAGEVDGATTEAHGSLAAAELVRSGARDPDALALAAPELVSEFAGWHAVFASNALTVVYDPDSEFADAIRDDWRTALARDDIAVGRTDPARDPLGYRTLLALDLAGREGAPAADIRANADVFPETQLLRTLEAGGLDAAFAYRNMAVAHDLPRVDLPARLDLSDPDFAERYRTAEVTVAGETIRGDLIRYGAAYLTDRGKPFYHNLVEDAERLRESGFAVPETYPVVSGRDESSGARGRDE